MTSSSIWEPQIDIVDNELRTILQDTMNPLNGISYIGRGIRAVHSIAELRELVITVPCKHAYVTGYYTQGDGGGGLYWLDETDTVSADNGGTIIVAADDGRWKLKRDNPFLSVKQFGAVGNGLADDTAPVQAAFSQGGLISVPAGEFMIRAHNSSGGFAGVFPESNSCVVFEPGAKFKAITNDKDAYAIINIASKENITFLNPTIEGERSTHIGSTGEFGMGFYIRGSSNITLEGFDVSECWGDGIYIGQVGGVDACHNVRLIKGSANENRRQGLSVISVDGLDIQDCDFMNISGTPPAAGIDFEPNNTECLLDRITLLNVRTNNTACGILVDLNNFGDGIKTKTVNMRIINHSDESSDFGMTFTRCLHPTYGRIEIDNPKLRNNDNNSIQIRRWHSSGTEICIKSPNCINPNRAGNGAILNAAAIACYTLNSDASPTAGSGNVTIDDPRVVFETGITPMFPAQISFRDTKSSVVSNVRILRMQDNPATFIETTAEFNKNTCEITTSSNVVYLGNRTINDTFTGNAVNATTVTTTTGVATVQNIGFIKRANGAVSIAGTTSTATITLPSTSLWRAGMVRVRGYTTAATSGTPGATSIGGAESVIYFRSKLTADVPVQISKTDPVTNANLVLSVTYLASPARVVITATTPVATLISWDVEAGGSMGAASSIDFL